LLKSSKNKLKAYLNYLLQILKTHTSPFQLEMKRANKKLFYTEKKIIPINLTLLNELKYSTPKNMKYKQT
jgi:hypothetical protein